MVTSRFTEVGDRISKVTFCFIFMKEIWKDVVGYVGLYQVSNLGRVKSCSHLVKCKNGYRIQPCKHLKNCFDNHYYHVTLFLNGKRKIYLVHRLVAQAFIPNPKNLPQVNHKDGNKTNNNAKNLEWVTCSENIKHAFRVGLNHAHDGGTSKPILAYDTNGIFVKEYKSTNEAARVLKVSTGNIWSVLSGKRKQIKGFVFKYK